MAKAFVVVDKPRSNNLRWAIDHRHTCDVVATEKFEPLDFSGDVLERATFVLVEEAHAPTVAAQLAKANPGCEIKTFTLSSVGICPPGEFVTKKVSEKGILPE